MSDKEKAATIIQKVYRMWKAKTMFQQLNEYKVQKQNQLSLFSEQIEVYGEELLNMVNDTNTPVSHRAQRRRASMEPPPRHLRSYGDARTHQMERMSTMKQPWTEDDELYYRRLLADKNARNERATFEVVEPKAAVPVEIEPDDDTSYSTKNALNEECNREELLDRLEQEESNQTFRKWQALRRLIAFTSSTAAAAANTRQRRGSNDPGDDDEDHDLSDIEVPNSPIFERGEFGAPSEVL